MADYPTLEPWTSPLGFTDGLWMSDGFFARETETLSRALQFVLSTDTYYTADVLAAAGSPVFPVKRESASCASDADSTATKRTRKPALSPPARKVSKRKYRARGRSTGTTFIAVDAANFLRMVQEVTGIQFSGPHAAAEAASVKPEPRRGWSRAAAEAEASHHPPTLDTSAVLLERARSQGSFGSVPSGPGFGIEPPFPGFPTLDSSGLM